ncbi:MAG: 16S rRNA (guanine(527)-N(7))-methyltransferase RsmG [Heliobacteriaceae bacterium]|jgi:16S rRNA (guanine527-N7)-methyltransferase|nr:16S rRNA (guanine(527)-N(7))-methyltransferase RsmG [Heliobacteriaceae bacterium]
MKSVYEKYMQVFLEKNSRLNLISKNDEKFLWEKHVFDSLAIKHFFKLNLLPPKPLSLLDIGTGGGFPAVPAAIAYPEIEVFAVDSIRKKINAIEEMKQELGLKNLHPVCGRAESLQRKFDIVTARAVAPLKTLAEYAAPLLNPDGCLAAYKSVKVHEEIREARSVLKKYNAKVIDIIEYELPLNENHTRNLVVIRF